MAIDDLLKKPTKLAKFLGTYGGVILDVLLDFFDPEPLADGTPPKGAKPIPPTSPEPPTKPNITNTNNYNIHNVIRHTNVNIFNQYNFNFPVVPELPSRNLPQTLPSTDSNTEQIYANTVKKSLANRDYGGLLAKPFYDDDIEICYYAQDSLPEFLSTLLSDLAVEETEDAIDKLAVAFMSFADDAPPLPIPSLKAIHDIASYYGSMARTNGFDVTGLIHVGNLTVTDCSRIITDLDIPPMTVEFPTDECAIPLAMYNDMEGYKGDQLQIIWRNRNYSSTNQYPKTVVLPSPRPIGEYSEELFRSVLPQWRYSGLTRLDIELQGDIPENRLEEEGCNKWAKQAFLFTDLVSVEEIENYIDTEYKLWIQQLCTDDVRVKKFVSNGYSSIDIKETWCYPYRAVYMGWDVTGKRWITKAHWYIHKQQPQGSP